MTIFTKKDKNKDHKLTYFNMLTPYDMGRWDEILCCPL